MVRFVGVRENARGFGMARLCCDISATVRIYTEHKTHRSVLSVVLTVVRISFSFNYSSISCLSLFPPCRLMGKGK